MQFKIRQNSIYLDVVVEINDTKIELGLHDDKERIELAQSLLEAVTELIDGVYKDK